MLGGPVDEEERWLDALEKGELDDNGELKKEIDESLLTARQVRKRWKQETCSSLSILSEIAEDSYKHLFLSAALLFLFRKPCYTSSRSSHSWSCPWATKKRR